MNAGRGRPAQAVKRLVLGALNACERLDKVPATLDPQLWGMAVDGAGQLWWDGCCLEELAADFGTPLHVVSRKRLEADYRGFHGAFAARYPRVAVAYSYKTNPLPGVLQALHACGADAEVISHFELWLALELGVQPRHIVFNGPAKTAAALDLALRSGIKLINIDGEAEIARLEACALSHGRRQAVGLRVITSMGWSGQFGFRIADGSALAAFRRLRDCAHLDPCALHLHLGTDIHDAGLYFTAAREVFAFARQLRSELGLQIRHVDLGGGFGVPTVRPLSSLELRYLDQGLPVRPPQPAAQPRMEDYADGIVKVAEEHVALDGGEAPELIFEPGRALTSSAQCLLLRVLSSKSTSGGVHYAIANGGRNLAMPLAYEYHELFAANRMREPADTRHIVCGPLCHPSDVVVAQRQLPRLGAGDLLAVMDAGAYFIPNQMNFSNPRPAVVMLVDGAPRLIRQRESFQDLVRLDASDG
jgi:diaminopimelate decarboxylase